MLEILPGNEKTKRVIAEYYLKQHQCIKEMMSIVKLTVCKVFVIYISSI